MEADERSLSLWGKILRLIPIAEIDEVSREVGLREIDETESLWSELCVLRDIIKENITIPALSEIPPSSSAGSKNNTSKVPSLPLNKSTTPQIHLYNSSAWTSSQDELVESISPYLNVDRIADVARDIRIALQEERTKIQNEISSLTLLMDQQTDAMLTDRTSPREMDLRLHRLASSKNSQSTTTTPTSSAVCSECGTVVTKHYPVSNVLTHSIPMGGMKKLKETTCPPYLDDGEGRMSVVCQACKEKKERRDRKLSDKLSKSLSLSSSSSTTAIPSSFTSSSHSNDVVFGSVSTLHEQGKEKKCQTHNSSSMESLGKGRGEEKLNEKFKGREGRLPCGDVNAERISSIPSSRVRNKLQAARDEKHFLEDT